MPSAVARLFPPFSGWEYWKREKGKDDLMTCPAHYLSRPVSDPEAVVKFNKTHSCLNANLIWTIYQ